MRGRDSKGRFIKNQTVKNQRRKANIKTTKEDGMVQTGNIFKKYIKIFSFFYIKKLFSSIY